MIRKKLKASYTIEAAIYIPIIVFILCQSVRISIDFWQQSRDREVSQTLQEMDLVQDFYKYQIIEELGKELLDD